MVGVTSSDVELPKVHRPSMAAIQGPVWGWWSAAITSVWRRGAATTPAGGLTALRVWRRGHLKMLRRATLRGGGGPRASASFFASSASLVTSSKWAELGGSWDGTLPVVLSGLNSLVSRRLLSLVESAAQAESGSSASLSPIAIPVREERPRGNACEYTQVCR